MGMGGGSCSTPGCEGGPNEDGLEFSYTIGLTTMDYPKSSLTAVVSRSPTPA